MKGHIKFLFLIILCITVVSFVACTNANNDKTITVEYIVDGNTYATTEIDLVNGSIVFPDRPLKDGFVFENWYYEEDFKTILNESNIKNVTGDIKAYAKFSQEINLSNFKSKSISINYELDGGLNDLSNPTEVLLEETECELKSPVKESKLSYESELEIYDYETFEFDGWYCDSTYSNQVLSLSDISTNVEISDDVTLYAKWNRLDAQYDVSTITRVDEEGFESATGGYVMFGEYPQTIKPDTVSITNTVDSRGYYLGSDSLYYAKINVARGSYSFSNSLTATEISSATDLYFRVEPLMWRIINETSGTLLHDAMLMSTIALDMQVFDTATNNYQNSFVRTWLNGAFYSKAFNTDAQNKIKYTTVDNSAASTGKTSNSYACSNTNDKIFLLSVYEVEEMLEKVAYKRVQASDYALGLGVQTNYIENAKTRATMFNNTCWWWLRSAYVSYGRVRYVNYDGNGSDCDAYRPKTGIVPAVVVNML